MNIGFDCPRCGGAIKPDRKPPYALRDYRLRGFICQQCGKLMIVASTLVDKAKARLLERIYEEHHDEGL